MVSDDVIEKVDNSTERVNRVKRFEAFPEDLGI